MFDCPDQDAIPPWRIQGDTPCTRVRLDVNAEQILCAASKAYYVRSYAQVPTDDYEPPPGEEGCIQ